MLQKRPLLGQILVENGAVTAPQLSEALAQQARPEDASEKKPESGNRERLGEVLIRLQFLTEERMLQALSEQWQCPYRASLAMGESDASLTRAVPIAYARRHLLLPIQRVGRTVQVACADPLNLTALDDLRLLLSAPIEPIVVPPRAVMSAIHHAYEQTAERTDAAISDLSDLSEAGLSTLAEELSEPEDLLEAGNEAPMIRLVNAILFQAVMQRASDIHIEPFEREMSIRYRIDGILYPMFSPPKRLQSPLTSRIKIMAGMNIAERRLPQDGRIGLRAGGREIDIRVSDVPTAHGERLVLRLLDKSNLLLHLSEIGLSHRDQATMAQLVGMAHGMVLVTGPTGSGKTTTLYAALNRINASDKNIITIEDPIEYQLKGVGQMQVNPKIDLTFSNGLRSILRQDPDIIMVGEIRDVDTAQIAIHASLTGHLVFSTLHTNDAAGAITRLLDMGIEPFLVSSSVVAILAQRLVRLVCSECKTAYTPPDEEVRKLNLPPGDHRFHRGGGCAHCLQTGYRGRSGIYEILMLDDELRALILAKADAAQIRARAISKGMVPLREDGAARVCAGITTAEEVLRVTQEEIEV
jgi:general secretion pathway protein E